MKKIVAFIFVLLVLTSCSVFANTDILTINANFLADNSGGYCSSCPNMCHYCVAIEHDCCY